jgi:hypothetical protein
LLARSFFFIAVPSSSIHDFVSLREHPHSPSEVLFQSSPFVGCDTGTARLTDLFPDLDLASGFTAARSLGFSVSPRFVVRFGSIIVSDFGQDLVSVSGSGFDSAF